MSGRVAAGSVAEQWLTANTSTRIVAFVSSVGNVDICPDLQHRITACSTEINRDSVDRSIVRCPDDVASDAMIKVVHALHRVVCISQLGN